MNPTARNETPSPSRARVQSTRQKTPANPITVAPLEIILPRLDRVRRSGKGYSAKCPAHEDRNASLSVTASDDGRVLLHCFAGCAPTEVCASLGLTVADLFPPRPQDLTPEGQQQLRQHARQARWGAALGLLELEAGVLLVAAGDVLAGKMTPDNLQRASLAAARIADARAVLR